MRVHAEAQAREDGLDENEHRKPEQDDAKSRRPPPRDALLRDAVRAPGVSGVVAGQGDAGEVEPEPRVEEDEEPPEKRPPEKQQRGAAKRRRIPGESAEPGARQGDEEAEPEERR